MINLSFSGVIVSLSPDVSSDRLLHRAGAPWLPHRRGLLGESVTRWRRWYVVLVLVHPADDVSQLDHEATRDGAQSVPAVRCPHYIPRHRRVHGTLLYV